MKDNIYLIDTNNIKLLILYFVVFFSTTLNLIFAPLKFLMVILPIFIIIYFLIKTLLYQGEIIYLPSLNIFIYYTVLCLPLYYFLSDIDFFYTPYMGFLNISLFVLLWYFIFNNESSFEYIFFKSIKLLILIGIIIAIGTLIQYFLSPTLYGLISNDIYAQDLSDKPNITKRAISFISSPQSLSLFLSIILILSFYNIKNTIINTLVCILILIAGLLTFSKVFLLVLITFIGVKLLFNLNFTNIIYIIIFIITLIFSFINFSDSNRAFEIIHILTNLKSHVTFLIWIDFINYDTTFLQFLFGHGLGITSRAAQMFGEYSILNGSTESFILQIYFEIGIVGLILFLLMYIKAIMNFLNTKKYKTYGILLISFLPSLLGTPSFYGLTGNFVLSLFLISGLVISNIGEIYEK